MWKHPKPKKMLSKWFWSNSWSSFPNRYTLSSHQSGPYRWDFFRRTSWKLHMTVWIVSYSVVRYGKIGVKATFVLMICWFCKKLFIAEKVGIFRWSSFLLFRYLAVSHVWWCQFAFSFTSSSFGAFEGRKSAGIFARFENLPLLISFWQSRTWLRLRLFGDKEAISSGLRLISPLISISSLFETKREWYHGFLQSWMKCSPHGQIIHCPRDYGWAVDVFWYRNSTRVC